MSWSLTFDLDFVDMSPWQPPPPHRNERCMLGHAPFLNQPIRSLDSWQVMIDRFALSFLCIELDRNVRTGVTGLYILLTPSRTPYSEIHLGNCFQQLSLRTELPQISEELAQMTHRLSPMWLRWGHLGHHCCSPVAWTAWPNLLSYWECCRNMVRKKRFAGRQGLAHIWTDTDRNGCKVNVSSVFAIWRASDCPSTM